MGFNKEVGTITHFHGGCLEETVESRFSNCGLLNIIQHIDIFGKFRCSYVEQRSPSCDAFVAVSSISSSSRRFKTLSLPSLRNVDSKLSRFSKTTKVSELYPGHDILGQKARRRRTSTSKSNAVFGVLVPI